MPALPLIERARLHADRVAIHDASGSHTYGDLLERSQHIASRLLGDRDDLEEARVAYLASAGAEYTSTMWGIWLAGGVAVPLSHSATERELEYVFQDANPQQAIASHAFAERITALCETLGVQLLGVGDKSAPAPEGLPELDPKRRAMILYTSGTTGGPKGVVTSHATIQAQIESLVQAWRWSQDDRIPLFLPLHHVHGIINIMSCALWAGASIEAMPRFDAEHILTRVAERAYTVFMAVPTIYVKIVSALESMDDDRRKAVLAGFSSMRLMVSGSAALPASVHQQWQQLTGQALLERYGMTEIGMALSNPYDGERRAGAVGQPLPGVEVRLVADDGSVVQQEEIPGEIQVAGPLVFKEYWGKPQETADSFDGDWFKSGDLAVVENGYYRIMGRKSIDIIKSGGYKLSALEIENVLLEHPDIAECAVIGLPDDTWGERVAAAAVLTEGSNLDLQQLREWSGDRLSSYKTPREFMAVEGLPRNAMGKVKKPDVVRLFD